MYCLRKIHIHIIQSKHSSKSPASPLVPHLLRDGNVGEIKHFFWGASPQDIQMRQYISIHISGAVSGVFKGWDKQSEAKSWTLKLGWSHGSWFASVLCACGELRHLSLVSQPSPAHSLLIYQSLSLLLGSANYSWAPATAACLIWRCAGWLWCLYQHERAGDQVLIEQKGIMRLPAPGGGTIFKIYMFNSYFILLSGDFGPSFSQGLATFCTAITATCLLILLPFHLGNHTSLQAEQARLPEASHTSLLGWQPFLPLLISYGERLY